MDIKYIPIPKRITPLIFWMYDIHFPDLGRLTKIELKVPMSIKINPVP
jgi:hypothetical protein